MKRHPQTIPAVIRLHTACASIGLTLTAVASRAGYSVVHIRESWTGERKASAACMEKLKAVLGPEAWAYATGGTDRLPVAVEVPTL